jgi:prepilin-type N-terminal cleavage/methylation domain-containing protein
MGLEERGGYTAIELMAVIAIVGILVVVGLRGIRQYYVRQQLRGAVQELVTDLAVGRQEAKTRQENTTVEFSGCGQMYWVVIPNQTIFDKDFRAQNVSFTPSPNSSFVFDGRGMTNRTISIGVQRPEMPNQTASIRINPLGIISY